MKVTCIKSCVFCHKTRYVGGHTKKVGVIEMAQLARGNSAYVFYINNAECMMHYWPSNSTQD